MRYGNRDRLHNNVVGENIVFNLIFSGEPTIPVQNFATSGSDRTPLGLGVNFCLSNIHGVFKHINTKHYQSKRPLSMIALPFIFRYQVAEN